MSPELVIQCLEQIEAQAALLQSSARVLRQAISEAIQPVEPTRDESGNCLHPSDARQAAAAMGKPGRFWCAMCGQFGGES